MQKIVIVTVYDSVNSGSYWQARAMGDAIKDLGYTPVYLKRRKNSMSSSSFFSKVINIGKSFIRYGFSSSKRYFLITKEFKNATSYFNIISENELDSSDIRAYILGSDTIWNLDFKYFVSNADVFWGRMFTNAPVIPYAASVGNTSIEKCREISDVVSIIKSWHRVSVRDSHTKMIISELSKISPELVCDPTLLFDSHYYTKFSKRLCKEKYIFIYMFSMLNKKTSDELVDFAHEYGYKVIIGSSHVQPAYCDKIIINSPITFISYMLYADYVITDTFHGTVFSLNFNKNFIAIDKGKKKVHDILSMVNMQSRLLNNSSISELFLASPDYTECNYRLDQLRKKSWSFLIEALGNNNG